MLRHQFLFRAGAILFIALAFTSCTTTRQKAASTERTKALTDVRATYCSVPRLPNGRADTDKLVSELVELRANTYSFCIHAADTDWDDLKLFLPKARARGIRVWASIVPPTESPPNNARYAEPFRLDYERWAVEFAKLSRREPNLVAWSIDDFTHNLKFFSTEKLRAMLSGARKINPKLAFVPCCYYRSITPQFATNQAALLDGILFPYRDESGGANLTNATHVQAEVRRIKDLVGPSIPVIFDVYASAHSRLGATTPQYVEQVMTSGKQSADGVMVYCHQNPQTQAEKFQIVKRLFNSWADEKNRIERRKNLRGTFGSYDAEPRLESGRVDVQRLVTELTKIKANTYNFLIWHATNDWDDLKLFLPLAREKGIKVWITLVPPTEAPPMYGTDYSEPFRLDYKRWGIEIAKLSLHEPNLVAWSLDDFTDNIAVAKTFKPGDWLTILSTVRDINPKLAFVPCCYFQHLTPQVGAEYRDLIDGILFPYMHAARGMNLTDTDTIQLEVRQFKELFGSDMPVFIDVYATHHSSLNETTPEYVEKVMREARRTADGVLIYCHQYEDKDPGKYRVIKNIFDEWSQK